jgi:molecular chaperone GrpE
MNAEALKPERTKIKVRRLGEVGGEETKTPQPTATQQAQEDSAADENDWRERYLRLAADLENTKKRLAKNADRRVWEEKGELILDLLPIADNLERILTHMSQGADKDLEQGLRITLSDFMARMRKQGLVPVDAIGERFDPSRHEAVGAISHADAAPGEVVEVEQQGYELDGRLLRPARVLIAE